jgi:uncharacterized protein (TIGR02996 family)
MEDRDFFAGLELDGDDDALRLVYSDWLEEHGTSPETAEQTEFLRLSVRERCLPPEAPEAAAIRERLKALRTQLDEEWVLPVELLRLRVPKDTPVKTDLGATGRASAQETFGRGGKKV